MKQTAEIIDIDEARLKPSGSGGGFDHFPGMDIGTVFCCMSNGDKSSLTSEFMLMSKQGITVLLKSADTGHFERHIGQRFWSLNTMVQILHKPEKKEQENGTSA